MAQQLHLFFSYNKKIWYIYIHRTNMEIHEKEGQSVWVPSEIDESYSIVRV